MIIVNARDLHVFLGNKDLFANWVKQRIMNLLKT
ncbi:antA/AntB antirepressor family protein [Providencia rettgeri]|uniref:AntA/AntB antirepressor family protein n=1 Tax=Providencia rettgeri TaxID=587 RepID=A0A939SJK9_PRORE|nr:antA/AntB antirepressor family protein [Providencia rettgeri]